MKKVEKDGWQDRPPAAFCGVSSRAGAALSPRASTREFFTVDLRGLRAALTARAAATGMTLSRSQISSKNY